MNALVLIMVTSVALAACGDSSDNLPLPETSPDPPVGAQADTRIQVDSAPEQKETIEPAPASGKEKTHQPLNLSLPPQPAAVPGARNNTSATSEHILPDLFQPDQEPDDDSSIHLKGRVLMKQGAEQNIDAMEGGQVTIEMKTR